MSNLADQLRSQFPDYEFKLEEPLARYTTVKIGGPAEVFYEAKDQKKLIDLLQFSIVNKIKITMLGWGANVLISDKGIRGLVIKNRAGEIKILDQADNVFVADEVPSEQIMARWDADGSKGSFKYDFSDLNYSEAGKPRVLVEIDAGVNLNQAIVQLINKGITGLQWFARIPSTIGGGIYNNIHGGTHFISEVLETVTVLNEEGKIVTLPKSELKFDYDQSRFHDTKEIILSAVFNLYRGDALKAKNVVIEWNKRKAVQPNNSLGCTFKNITNEEKERLGYPTTSVGYLVEHILNLKGYHIGDAVVSDAHCAFIENKGAATAEQYLQVIKTIISQTKSKTGLIIKPEIFFLGFEKSELEGIVS
ncbi:FAD-binding protein [Patescibacteria group bacterium]|nr:FAD-binding protein [Patescibacteria group bacterium]